MSRVPRTRLANTIAATTLKNGISRSYAREVAAYLLSEGRVSELDSVLRDIQADWASQGFMQVIAASAYPLSSQVKADIISRVRKLHPEADQIAVIEMHDPAVIGSVRLSLPNEQLDLSVEAKLNKFKQLTAAGKDY